MGAEAGGLLPSQSFSSRLLVECSVGSSEREGGLSQCIIRCIPSVSRDMSPL